MPVEDVDFLTKHSLQDSYLFFVDSSLRNKEAYPSTSEYEIRFSEPFSNVYGLEVMDAMVPSTRYTFDVGHDEFKFHVALVNESVIVDDAMWWSTMNCLYGCKSFRNLLNSVDPEVNGYTSFITVFEKGDAVISPSEISVEASAYKACQVQKILFNDVDVSIYANQEIDVNDYVLYVNNDNNSYVISKQFLILNDIMTNYDSSNLYIDWTSKQIWVIDMLNLTVECYHRLNITSFGVGGRYEYTDYNIWFTISCILDKIEHGNYDIFTYQAYANAIISNYHAYSIDNNPYYYPFNDPGTSLPNILQNTIYGNVERQSKYKYAVVTPNIKFFINITQTNIANAIGFASKSPTPGATLYYTNATQWPNKSHYVITTAKKGFENIILTPGIVNLNGLSYCILRCPEIESHMYNSFSYSQNCPGIGMFKLGALNQIINVRFDFVNFIKKPFHPIGKLPKLTFRFETTDGQLYDFKGVDHNMLLNVKFYVPRLKEPQQKFILNPNYNPNYLEYMIKQMQIDDEQDDEDAEWDTSLDDRRAILQDKYSRLIQEQNKYDYSSDEDNEEIDIVDRYTY
jgi:hypothetical protein